MECEKLATEKTEMQRHYVMYYEMSYGLNVEMHKQVCMAKTGQSQPVVSMGKQSCDLTIITVEILVFHFLIIWFCSCEYFLKMNSVL